MSSINFILLFFLNTFNRYSAVRILPLIGREVEKFCDRDDDRLMKRELV